MVLLRKSRSTTAATVPGRHLTCQSWTFTILNVTRTVQLPRLVLVVPYFSLKRVTCVTNALVRISSKRILEQRGVWVRKSPKCTSRGSTHPIQTGFHFNVASLDGHFINAKGVLMKPTGLLGWRRMLSCMRRVNFKQLLVGIAGGFFLPKIWMLIAKWTIQKQNMKQVK